MLWLGGDPIAPRDGEHNLSNHGQLTEVSEAGWVAARVCRWLLLAAFVAGLGCGLALLVRKAVMVGEDLGPDHSKLVLAAVMLAMLSLLSASALGP